MPMNCWEMKRCGREPGGPLEDELGVCVASTAAECEGVNRGHMGGRVCWALAGTFCKGKVQGSSAAKRTTCLACEFYNMVHEEEGNGFLIKPPHH